MASVTIRNNENIETGQRIGVQVIQPSSGTEVGLLYVLNPGQERTCEVYKNAELVIKEI